MYFNAIPSFYMTKRLCLADFVEIYTELKYVTQIHDGLQVKQNQYNYVVSLKCILRW